MKVSTPTPPPPPAPVDPGQSATSYLNAMSDPALQQRLFDIESTYRPQYTSLNLQDMQDYLQGVGGAPGALSQLQQATPLLGQIQATSNTQQRQADINDVSNLGGQAAAAFRAANPELQNALARAQGLGTGVQYNQQDNLGGLQALLGQQPNYAQIGQLGQGQLGASLYSQALGANGLGSVGQKLSDRAAQLAASTGKLTPEELRASQQSIREAYAARGTDMSSGAVSAEALGRLADERGRMMQDLQMASALNQASQAELGANRSFASGVYGQELGRGVTNIGVQDANRSFAANQYQQQVQNQALLGQLQAAQQQQAFQNQLAAQGQDRNYALQLAQMQAATSFDPMMAILGRSSQSLGAAQQQQGLAANLTSSMQGPQLFDPNAGINLGLQNASNLGNYQAATYGAQANAQGQITGGLFQGLGSMLGSLGGAGIAAMCWVAREVYGQDNPKWVIFRHWMLTRAPKWLLFAYLKYGERFARFISNKPRIKAVIRKWMDGRIEAYV